MRPSGESPMKVLVTQDFLATRSTASKSRLSILEPAGPRLPPSQPCLEVLADEIVAKNFFCFTYFHGLSAASPLGWALRMTSGKVRIEHSPGGFYDPGVFGGCDHRNHLDGMPV